MSLIKPGILKKYISQTTPIVVKTVAGKIRLSNIQEIYSQNCGKKLKFYVCDFADNHEGLLGYDILKQLCAKIDVIDESIILNGIIYKFFKGKYLETNTLQMESSIQSEIKKTEFRLDHLNQEEFYKIRKLLDKYKDIFYNEGDTLTFTNKIKHQIKTIHEDPIYTKSYRYPEVHRNEVNEQIRTMLEQGIICHSASPYSAPIWVVPKKLDSTGTRKWRIVVDYRKLNDITINDKYPIPNMDDILDKLGRCLYFSTIDLKQGFHQIEMDPNDRLKTAFSTQSGHYEFLRMPFGLKNAPSTFQRLMNTILDELI